MIVPVKTTYFSVASPTNFTLNTKKFLVHQHSRLSGIDRIHSFQYEVKKAYPTLIFSKASPQETICIPIANSAIRTSARMRMTSNCLITNEAFNTFSANVRACGVNALRILNTSSVSRLTLVYIQTKLTNSV